ncbi:MAG: hypothetical protein DRG30_05760 [Epsilonproteobacteria bacterium]|nr:MAG: hypothetical protein DRG30_05760 [Campylobacterota bacterium]
MKFLEKEYFELEVGEDIYTGNMIQLSKKQIEAIEKMGNKALLPKIEKAIRKSRKIERKIEIKEKLNDWESVEKLQDELSKHEELVDTLTIEIDKINQDDLYKKRLELSLVSDEKREIMELGKKYSYENVLNTILLDIKERKAKN